LRQRPDGPDRLRHQRWSGRARGRADADRGAARAPAGARHAGPRRAAARTRPDRSRRLLRVDPAGLRGHEPGEVLVAADRDRPARADARGHIPPAARVLTPRPRRRTRTTGIEGGCLQAMQNTRLDVPEGVPVELCTTYMHYSRRTPRG